MSKTLFFVNTLPLYHSGNNDAKLNAAASWWIPVALSEVRGAGALTTATPTVVGTTNGVEVQQSGFNPNVWYSGPLSADFTISGVITFNLWAFEGTMNANAGINAQIEKIDGATGAITLIVKSAFATELGTSGTANNFTATPGAGVLCHRGDRLRVRVFAKDAGGTMAVDQFSFTYAGTTAAASGDSFITFTENLTFETAGDPGIVYAENVA
jgi:hypothetical protein